MWGRLQRAIYFGNLETGENRSRTLKSYSKISDAIVDYKVGTIDTSLDDLFIVAINQNYIPITATVGFLLALLRVRKLSPITIHC